MKYILLLSLHVLCIDTAVLSIENNSPIYLRPSSKKSQNKLVVHKSTKVANLLSKEGKATNNVRSLTGSRLWTNDSSISKEKRAFCTTQQADAVSGTVDYPGNTTNYDVYTVNQPCNSHIDLGRFTISDAGTGCRSLSCVHPGRSGRDVCSVGLGSDWTTVVSVNMLGNNIQYFWDGAGCTGTSVPYIGCNLNCCSTGFDLCPCGNENSILCPVDCSMSDWSEWDVCSTSGVVLTSLTCDGVQSRTRTIDTAPANGGTACPALSETQPCNRDMCPIDCEMSDWSDWDVDCSALEVICHGGQRSRSRNIIQEPANEGTACTARSETQPCPGNVCEGLHPEKDQAYRHNVYPGRGDPNPRCQCCNQRCGRHGQGNEHRHAPNVDSHGNPLYENCIAKANELFAPRGYYRCVLLHPPYNWGCEHVGPGYIGRHIPNCTNSVDDDTIDCGTVCDFGGH